MRGGVYSSVSALGIKTLSRIVGEADLPLSMQCDALQILHKMLLYRLQNLPQDNMLELSPLLTTIENSAESFIMSKSLLAIHVLADLSMKLSRRAEMGSAIASSLPGWCRSPFRKFKACSVFYFLWLENIQTWVSLFWIKLGLFIEYLVDVHEGKIVTRQERLSVPEIFDFKGENVGISLKLAYYVHKFSVSCIEIINEAGAITTQVVDKVKLLVQSVHRCSLFHWYVLIMYSILMHSHSMWNYVLHNKKESCNPDSDLNSSLCSDLVEREFFTLDCAKKLLTERDNWSAYKAGTFAACQGAWITAAFVFEQLTNWSKINKFPVILFQDISNELGQGAVENIHEPNYTEMLLQTYHGLCSSRKTLESIVTSNKSFCFQRWFLAIRVELLGTMENIVKVLGATPITEDSISKNRKCEKKDEYLNCLRQITQSSFRLNRLVQEYDLISMSFIGMDSRSSKIISTLALSCFLLAFATGFAILISDPLANDILMPCDMENSKNYLQGMLVQNVIRRGCAFPFRVPTYFFKIRPCIGSELFVFNADTRNSNQLSILPGFNLSLNLCLQLRNLPPDLPFGVTRSYCVLYSSMSFQDSKENGETKGQFLWENRTLDSDNLIQMNEKLLHHVTECSTKKTTNSKRGREKDIDSDEIITGFACFDLIDARKGFSNCLLDVSRFPVGSYRIKWQSCCIDSQGSYWSLLPLNAGPVFTVQKPTAV
ncbi:hypothetical protein OIU77_005698 [Salix suchowensis]|uniref:Integrator complex subunit 7-like C-terminal domain-containing protein n=1 Tax=Salix suchowensis TaxID=1278906 RepID=A0ABQ9ARF4_9ROSI|nr:hypothetical protein OIU77_005698 [Salix suchowensis]